MALALGAACAPPMPMFEQLDASEASVSRPDVVAMDRFTSALDASDDRSMTSARDVNVIADDAAPACDGDASACPTRANAAARCVGNRCAYECLGSYADCNNEPRDGCELDTASSVNNCGACGVSCPAANNATATCTAGACLFTCSSGFADCDRDRSNGCEADTSRSPDNCGTCATRCSAAANATATCSSGTCAIACAAGFANCDGNNGNGCEQRTSDDADHCGMCGNRCPAAANATARCAMGACGIVCAAGFANCDGSSSNGCEATLASDVSHCGACGNRCSAGINSVASCRMGVCSSQCSPGFADCDGNDLNGCEVDTRTTLAHCGTCGAVCTSARPGTTPVCTMGMCRAVCSTGFFDCDGDATNGCEIDTRSSAMNCGACGTVCPMRPNSVALCSSSMCSSRCVTGFSDCDGNSANGCETAAPSCP
ncbi:MAG: hypothetical protein U0269_16015 [Polyangiales bacterium]